MAVFSAFPRCAEEQDALNNGLVFLLAKLSCFPYKLKKFNHAIGFRKREGIL
jgi:hypothetical protein